MKRADDAVIAAVLTTLLRATVDSAIPVVLRRAQAAQVQALSQWLWRAHGSRRTVIAAAALGAAPITLRLPARMSWPSPALLAERAGTRRLTPLASAEYHEHLSRGQSFPSHSDSA
jgi:hypothetical protein